MADRYWVGGTASWDGTAGTKWAATSNGPGGETVPTTADDVFFDASSTGTVTIATGNTGAKSITCTGFTGTLTGTAAISVAGNVTLVSGMTYSHTGSFTFTGTGTLTTAGKTFSGVTVDGVGITLTLGDALNISTRVITVTQGTFDTANYNVTAASLFSAYSNTRTINFGSSTVTLSSQSSTINFSLSTNLTFNAGTSLINFTNFNANINASNLTFYDVSFGGTGVGPRGIGSGNTFRNFTASNMPGGAIFEFAGSMTVTGTLNCSGSNVYTRVLFRSNTLGTTRTLNVNTLVLSDVDFRDITISGSAAGTSPTRAGDCGGNSGITFPAAKTVYRVGTDTTWPGSSSWALTSGGTGDNANFPLPQDTAVINEDTALTGTLSLSVGNIGALDCSNRTTGITLDHNNTTTRYGSYILGSGVTVSGTAAQTFSGRGTMTFTSAGKTILFPIVVDAPSGTFELGDATTTSNTITHTRGTFDGKTYNLTCTQFSSSNSNTRTVNMGSGLWTLSGTGTVWNTATTTNLTLNNNSADILLSDTSTTSRTFDGGGLVYNKLTVGGSTGVSTLSVNGANTFSELASTKTVSHTVTLGGNLTLQTWSVTGSSGNVVTVNSSSSGTRRTIQLTNATSGIDYLSVKDIRIPTTNLFCVGTNSTNNGNNQNVYFSDFPPSGSFFMLFN